MTSQTRLFWHPKQPQMICRVKLLKYSISILCNTIPNLSKEKVIQRHLRLWVNCLQIPSEGFALEIVSKVLPEEECSSCQIQGIFIQWKYQEWIGCRKSTLEQVNSNQY